MAAAVAVANTVRGALRATAEGGRPEAEGSGAGARREPPPAAEQPQGEREGERLGDAQEEEAAGPASPQGHTPAYGAVCVKGRRPAMEDRVTMKLRLLGCEGCEEGSPLHFFAVYDGHGGKECATLCSQRLHGHLAEELRGQGLARLGLGLCAPCHLAGVDLGADGGAAGPSGRDGEAPPTPTPMPQDQQQQQQLERADRACREAFRKAFQRTDAETCEDSGMGSTAVVALVAPGWVAVANVGDSRAVLGRADGAWEALSDDHKPNRPDERQRVEAAGGHVISWNGARVMGVLAMSRALGDRFLRPYVIADPEITFTRRAAQDEVLVLASDGLWDVVSNGEACAIAAAHLKRARAAERSGAAAAGGGGGGDSEDAPLDPAKVAAGSLVKLALARGSCDNISVVVVDLNST